MVKFIISLCIFILCSWLFSCQASSDKENQIEKKKESLDKNIGNQFKIDNLIDTSSKPFTIDFTKSDITIIDFWINECPPCNAEMSQFADLIKGRDKQISIISISVSSFQFWNQLFADKSPRYSFLKASVSNWQHANLKSDADQTLKNLISVDRLSEITKKWNVTFFPSYFVVNKQGIILARPESAVEYLKRNYKS